MQNQENSQINNSIDPYISEETAFNCAIDEKIKKKGIS